MTKKWGRTKKRRPRRWTHFTVDGKTRYCTGRPKGKDNLADSWSYVDCQKCTMKHAFSADIRRQFAESGEKSGFQKKKGDREH